MPQLLNREQYTSQEVFEQERERVLMPAWSYVGLKGQLAKPGDFITEKLYGVPIIVRNFDGELRAFVNVCAHRFATLTDKPHGNCSTFSCQYHGWEYGADGLPRKIPDAGSFRPFKKGMAKLSKLRVESIGQLVFVSFAEVGPTLAEALGPGAAWWEDKFHVASHLSYQFDGVVPLNWKPLIENTLESYHLTCVHSKTFGATPPEELCNHEFHADKTIFFGNNRSPPSFMERMINKTVRGIGRQRDCMYQHGHVYPNMTFGLTDLTASLMVFHPVSAKETRVIWLMFMLQDNTQPGRWHFWNWFNRMAGRYKLRPVWKRIWGEDSGIVGAVQRGLSSPVQPKGGLISIREERIFHFQNWWCRQMGVTPPVAEVSSEADSDEPLDAVDETPATR